MDWCLLGMRSDYRIELSTTKAPRMYKATGISFGRLQRCKSMYMYEVTTRLVAIFCYMPDDNSMQIQKLLQMRFTYSEYSIEEWKIVTFIGVKANMIQSREDKHRNSTKSTAGVYTSNCDSNN